MECASFHGNSTAVVYVVLRIPQSTIVVNGERRKIVTLAFCIKFLLFWSMYAGRCWAKKKNHPTRFAGTPPRRGIEVVRLFIPSLGGEWGQCGSLFPSLEGWRA